MKPSNLAWVGAENVILQTHRRNGAAEAAVCQVKRTLSNLGAGGPLTWTEGEESNLLRNK